MDETKSEIRTIIEAHITACGKTKAEVAKDAGINSGNLNKMLNSPSWPTLERIANALDLSVPELITPMDKQESMKPTSLLTCPYCGRELKLTKAENEPNPNRSDASS